MRRLLPAVLFLASCADAPVQPPFSRSNLTRVDPTLRSFTDVSWTTSTTGIDVAVLGQFGGAFTTLIDLNDNGLAVGWRNVPGVGERAISWQNGVFTDLGTLGGGFSRAYQVNEAGVIVGEASDEFGVIKPVVWENGVIRALPALDPTSFRFGFARAINERGDVVGSDSRSFQWRAVLWPAEGGVVEIGALSGGDMGWATGVNNQGHAIGQTIYFADFSRRAMRWVGGNLTEVSLPAGVNPAGGDIGQGRMFNDAGDFLGERADFSTRMRGGVYRDGQFQFLPSLPGAFDEFTQAFGINEAGDIAGGAMGTINERGVVWKRDGTLIDLGLPSPSFRGLVMARGINNSGYVIGEAFGEWEPEVVEGRVVVWRLNTDVTPPVISWSAHPSVFTVDQAIAITCTAMDEGSGIASHTCADFVGDAFTFGLGEHTFTASATDNAGNSATASTSFTVTVTHASLTSLTRRFFSDAGVANGLAKLLASAERAAKGHSLQGFRSAVSAHVGKGISAEQAAILIELSRHL